MLDSTVCNGVWTILNMLSSSSAGPGKLDFWQSFIWSIGTSTDGDSEYRALVEYFLKDYV